MSPLQNPWIIFGYFNCTVSFSERLWNRIQFFSIQTSIPPPFLLHGCYHKVGGGGLWSRFNLGGGRKQDISSSSPQDVDALTPLPQGRGKDRWSQRSNPTELNLHKASDIKGGTEKLKTILQAKLKEIQISVLQHPFSSFLCNTRKRGDLKWGVGREDWKGSLITDEGLGVCSVLIPLSLYS